MSLQLIQAWDAARALAYTVVAWIPRLVIAVLVFALFWILAGVARSAIQSVLRRSGRRENVGLVLGRLGRWAVIFAGVLVALAVVSPSLDAGTLVGVLGLSSVAIGFAFKDILQNFLAGILVLLSEPFRVGDQIVSNGHEGTVVEIETRSTTIKTYDGRKVVLPNAQLYTEPVTVNTAYDLRRSQYDFGIDYEDDVDLAERLIEEAIDETDGIVDEPAPQVYVLELADSSVNLRARWWTEPEKSSVVELTDRLIRSVKQKFDANGVDFPYPIRDVRLTRETGAGAGEDESGGDEGGEDGRPGTA